MKRPLRAICLLTALVLICSVSACEMVEDVFHTHETAASEIAEQNGQRNQLRKEFLESKACQSAGTYLTSAIQKEAPDADVTFSIEPGSYYHESLAPLTEPVENADQARAFFAKAQLSFSVTVKGDTPTLQELAQALASQGISGQLSADSPRSAYYDLNGTDGTAVYTPVPEV